MLYLQAAHFVPGQASTLSLTATSSRSVKAGERVRCAGGIGSVDLTVLTADVPIPHQLDKFWTSPTHKTHLQRLVHQLVSTHAHVPLTVTAELLRPSKLSDPTSAEIPETIDELTYGVEEADGSLVLQCAWEVYHGNSHLLVH